MSIPSFVKISQAVLQCVLKQNDIEISAYTYIERKMTSQTYLVLIWYDMIWYNTIRYDMICDLMWYHMIYDMRFISISIRKRLTLIMHYRTETYTERATLWRHMSASSTDIIGNRKGLNVVESQDTELRLNFSNWSNIQFLSRL